MLIFWHKIYQTSESECAIVHDDLWCSASPDSQESQLISEYKEFYFSDEVDAILVKHPGLDL
jgi:hypothetical protein